MDSTLVIGGPDTDINFGVSLAWMHLRRTTVGLEAIITAMLFNLGKLLFGLYIARSSVTSAFGAAGSLVIVLLWVWYSAQILFFGAKFTQVYSNRYSSHFEPVQGAEAVAVKEVLSE